MNSHHTTIQEIEQALWIAPVMGQFHPLLPLCLSDNVNTVDNPMEIIEELDATEQHVNRPILINNLHPNFSHRFKVLNHPVCPAPEIINQNLPNRISLARQVLLTSHRVADKIVEDVATRRYKIVILLLVDGLSYADVLDWPESVEPCFVDGPSITFSRIAGGSIDAQVGFPNIVGNPPLARRLMDFGLTRSRGFSYWEREQNDVSEVLFQGVPLTRVSGLSESFEHLDKLEFTGTYIQLVREGLDGLAHSRREVSQQEIQATIESIREDFRYLVDLLTRNNLYGAVYLVADHGILWKKQHQWQNSGNANHPRYSTIYPGESMPVSKFSTEQQDFHLWHYPYLGRSIKSNDSGVHGGLSYWESIVPFVRVEISQ